MGRSGAGRGAGQKFSYQDLLALSFIQRAQSRGVPLFMLGRDMDAWRPAIAALAEKGSGGRLDGPWFVYGTRVRGIGRFGIADDRAKVAAMATEFMAISIVSLSILRADIAEAVEAFNRSHGQP